MLGVTGQELQRDGDGESSRFEVCFGALHNNVHILCKAPSTSTPATGNLFLAPNKEQNHD